MDSSLKLAALMSIFLTAAGCITPESAPVYSFTFGEEKLVFPLRHDVKLEGTQGILIPIEHFPTGLTFVTVHDFTYNSEDGSVLEALFVSANGNVTSLLGDDKMFFFENPPPDDVLVEVGQQRVEPARVEPAQARQEGIWRLEPQDKSGYLVFAWEGNITGNITTYWPTGAALGPELSITVDFARMTNMQASVHVAAPLLRAVIGGEYSFGTHGEDTLTLLSVTPATPYSGSASVTGENTSHRFLFQDCHCVQRYVAMTDGRTKYEVEMSGAYVRQPDLLMMLVQLPASLLPSTLNIV